MMFSKTSAWSVARGRSLAALGHAVARVTGVPNKVNVWLVLSCSQPRGLWWQARISCMPQGGHPGGAQVKVVPSEQLHLEKVLTASGAKYLLAHVVTRNFTLAAGASMADMNSLFTGQIPTKVLISLVINEVSVSTWQKNSFNFAHIELNSACLVVDGRLLPPQPWQRDFMQGLYAKTYHALQKFSGMYPSYWSNGLHHWHLPAWFPAAYLINTARGGDAGEHWLSVFLKDSQHVEYFNSFGITPPESIYWRLLSMDYLDIWYSTKVLQGLFSRSCGL